MNRLLHPCKFLVVLVFLLSILSCRQAGDSTGAAANSSEKTAPIPDVQGAIRSIVTQDGSRDFTAEMRLTGVDAQGKRDQVEFRLQRKLREDGALTFLHVISPREESDKAMLAIEKRGEPTQAFSYLAGLKKLARLSSSRQLSFRGSKVTVQELLGMELSQYHNDTGERVTEDGQSLIKVVFHEKPDLGLAFPQIVAYFTEPALDPARFELFNSLGELQKKITVQEVKAVQEHRTLTRLSIEDLQQKLTMQLEIRKIEYDRGLKDVTFTEDRLKQVIAESSRRLDAGKGRE